MSSKNNSSWAFFGTSLFSVTILDELRSAGFVPNLLVTVPDKPKGRKLILTPSDTKIWAEKNGIPVFQPEKWDEDAVSKLSDYSFRFFVVASYGKIIPRHILDIPKHGALNVHPSLLPTLRGPSPIESAILKESGTGVTIIKLYKEMDHGPIIAQEKVLVDEWPPYTKDLENKLGMVGGQILVNVIPDWLLGKIKGIEQNHSLATFCKKIEKEDGKINLADSPEVNLRKIRAYHIWPGAFYLHQSGKREIRVIIKRAHIENGALILDRVLPEGKKEMGYKDFLRGLRN